MEVTKTDEQRVQLDLPVLTRNKTVTSNLSSQLWHCLVHDWRRVCQQGGETLVGKAGLVRTHSVETTRHDQERALKRALQRHVLQVALNAKRRSVGAIENQGVASQVRALKLCLEERFRRAMQMQLTCIPWPMRHSARCVAHHVGEALSRAT